MCGNDGLDLGVSLCLFRLQDVQFLGSEVVGISVCKVSNTKQNKNGRLLLRFFVGLGDGGVQG